MPMTVRRMTTIATSRFGGSAETCAETDGIDTQRFALQNLTKAHTKPGQMLPDWRAHFVSPNYFLRVNLGMQTLVFVASAAYALDLVLNKYPKANGRCTSVFVSCWGESPSLGKSFEGCEGDIPEPFRPWRCSAGPFSSPGWAAWGARSARRCCSSACPGQC